MARGNKREIILEAAKDLLYIKGFDATKTAEIAARAGVAEGTVFRYFKTKEDILLGVLTDFFKRDGEDSAISSVEKIIENSRDLDVKKVFRVIIKDRLAFVEQNVEYFWIAITEMKYNDKVRELVLENLIEKAISLLGGFFKDGIDRGVFRQCEPFIMARAFLSTVFSIVFQHRVFQQSFKTEDFDSFVDESINIFLHGILKEGCEA